MEKETLERAPKEQVKADSNRRGGAAESPTEKQIDYLLALAESVGVRVDVSNVKEKHTASEIIDALKVLRQHGLGKSEAATGGHGWKLGFDIAMTIVARSYANRRINPAMAETFWDDVKAFHATYQAKAAQQIATHIV